MSQMMEFHVTIRTSAIPVSGTYSSVWVSVIGALCESPPIQINPDQHRLLPGSVCSIVTKPVKDVGKVVLLKLRLEVKPGFPNLNWHCQEVLVGRSAEDPNVVVFPCHKWIRSADGSVELRTGEVCLKKQETLAILKAHRERSLQKTQQRIRWRTFTEGVPRCVDITDATNLDPNLSYVREHQSSIVYYVKGFSERKTSWKNMQELQTFFLFNGENNSIASYVKDHWKEDAFFGYQCLNGSNPLSIKQIRKIPQNLAVTPKMLSPFLPQGSTLKRELERGCIYLLDYEILDQLPANKINDKQTYLAAPLCLLHYSQHGELKPIAIQLQQTPGPQNPVFLPSDLAPDWLLAKMWVRHADFLIHQVLSHLLCTHFVGEVFCVATLRQLPEVHPLHQLLKPHVKSNLQINIKGRHSLLGADGVFNRSMSCGVEGAKQLLVRGSRRLRYSQLCVQDDLRSRGLDTLELCFYAQDALRVWDALHRFVEDWISLHYHSDEDIQQDSELQNWITEIHTEGFWGLNETGFPKSFKSPAELSKFVTMIIFCCSGLHSAMNFSQLDYNLWIPNSPAAMLRPPPQSKGLKSEDELLSVLPDVNSSCYVLNVLTVLSQRGETYVPLCHYTEWYFSSGATLSLVKKVKKELKKIAKDISARNRELALPYPYLSPDLIENSISI